MQENVWNKLLEFETRDLIERFIRKKYNRDASARQVVEISSNFIQGREYFKNAQRAAITVKPLLLYYGVAALTRGLVLAIQPHVSESSLKPSHGLDTVDWQAALATKDFGALSVIIREGTFNSLLTATFNQSYLKHNSSAVDFLLKMDVPEVNARITFKELVQTFPDLKEQFATWCEEPLHFAGLNSFKPIETKYQYSFSTPVNAETLNALFKTELYNSLSTMPLQLLTSVETPNTSHPQFSQKFGDEFRMGIGEVVLTKPIGDNLHLNSLAQFYCASYFLGMLCRYFPAIWISLARTEKGDAIYPLVISLLDLIEKQFPGLIMEYLSGPYPFEKKNDSVA